MADEVDERDVKEYRFQQLCKLSIGRPLQDIKSRVNHVVVSNKYGLIFAVSNTVIKVITLDVIEQISVGDITVNTAVSEFPHSIITVGFTIQYISLNCDNSVIFVVYQDGNVLKIGAIDVAIITESNKDNALFSSLALANGTALYANDVRCHPENPCLTAVALSNGHALTVELSSNNELIILSSITNRPVSCVCWSPKGKQIVMGDREGNLIQYDKILQTQKKITPPPDIDFKSVGGVYWISSFLFFVVYHDLENASEPPVVAIVTTQKDGPPSYSILNDIYYGFFEDRLLCFYFEYLPVWNLMISMASNAMEAAPVGKINNQWQKWALQDTGRAEMPLNVANCETYPIGIGICLNSTTVIKQDDRELPPAPVYVMLSTDGILCSYQMINQFPDTNHSILLQAQSIPPTATRRGKAQSIATPLSTVLDQNREKANEVSILKPPNNTFFNIGSDISRSSSAISDQKATFNTPSTSTGSFWTPPPANEAISSFGNVSQSSLFNFENSNEDQKSVFLPNSSAITSSSNIDFSGVTSNSPFTVPACSKSQPNIFGAICTTTSNAPAFNFKQPQGFPTFKTPSSKDKIQAPNVEEKVTDGVSPFSFNVSKSSAPVSGSMFNAPLPNTDVSSKISEPTQSLFTPVSRAPNAVSTPPSLLQPVVQQTNPPPVRQAPQQINMPQFSHSGFAPLSAVINQPSSTAQSVLNQRQEYILQQKQKADAFSQPTPVVRDILQQSGQINTPTSKNTSTIRFIEDERTDHDIKKDTANLDAALEKNIRDEIDSFNAEMNSFQQSFGEIIGKRNLIGSHKELVDMKNEIQKLDNLVHEYKLIAKENRSECNIRRDEVLKSFKLVDEAILRKEKIEDQRYSSVLRTRPLDPISVRQRKEIRDRYNQLEHILQDINVLLDAKWVEQEVSKKKGRARNASQNQQIFKTVEAIEQITQNLSTRVKNLTLQSQETQLLSMNLSHSSSFNHSDVLNKSTNKSNISEQVQLKKKKAHKLSMLKAYLNNRSDTPVRKPKQYHVPVLEEYDATLQTPLPQSLHPKAASTPAFPFMKNRRESIPNMEPVVEELPSALSSALAKAATGSTTPSALHKLGSHWPTKAPVNTPATPQLSNNMKQSTFTIDASPNITNSVQSINKNLFGFGAKKGINHSPTVVEPAGTRANAFPSFASTNLQGPFMEEIHMFGMSTDGGFKQPYHADFLDPSTNSMTNLVSSSDTVGAKKDLSQLQTNALDSGFRFNAGTPVNAISESKLNVSEAFTSFSTNAPTFERKVANSVSLSTSKDSRSTSKLFGSKTAVSAEGELFGSTTATSVPEGLFSPSISTNASGGLFGTASTTSALGGLFETSSTTTASGGLYGTASTSSASGGLFGTSSTTTASGGLFGTVSTSSASGGLFGASSTTSAPGGLFRTSITTSASGGLFGTTSTTSTSGGLFGTSSTTAASGGLFGTSSTTAASGGLFGTASTSSASGGLFGTSSTTTASGGLFGTASTSSASGGLFGTSSTTTASGGLFGTASTSSASGGLFGTSSTTTASGGLFGTVSTSSASGGLFGASSTTSAPGGLFRTSITTSASGGLFGTTSTTSASGGLFGTSSTTAASGGLFGTSSTTAASGGLFGTASTTSASGGLFGTASTSDASGGLFGTASTTSASGGLFGTASTTSASGGLFGTGSTTSASGGLFGTASTSNASGGLFGTASTTSASGGLFGTASTTSASGGLFGTASTTGASGGLFGTSSTTDASGGLFGTASTTSASGGLFGTASTTSASGGLFGTASTSDASGGLFGTASTSDASGGLFGTASTTDASGGLFGTASTTSASGGLFGTASTSNVSGELFGTASTTSASGGLFGTASTTSASGGLFGTASTYNVSGELFGTASTTSASGGLFGTSSTTDASGGLFGTASTTSASGGLFGTASTTSASGGLFGTESTTSASGGLFGTVSTENASGGMFGTSNSTSGFSSFGNISTSSGGPFETKATSIFGSSANRTSVGLFGSSTSVAPAFGSTSQQPSGGFSAFGLGGKPVNDPDKNPFGTVTAGSAGTDVNQLFGASKNNVFGQTSTTPSTEGGGSFSKGFGSGLASQQQTTGFGFGTNASASAPAFGSGSAAFGGGAAFGSGSAAFGGGAAFGSPPAFGGAPAFGSPPAFGSGGNTFGSGAVFGSSGSSQNTVFGSGSTTFGSLAGQTSGASTFGSLAGQDASSFGQLSAGPSSFSEQRGFGTNSPEANTASFSSWR